MNKVLVVSAALIVGAFTGISRVGADEVLADKPEEVSCRFTGLEHFNADGDVIRLKISESAQSATLQVGKDHRDVSVKKRAPEDLQKLKAALRDNLDGFETGKNALYTVEEDTRFLEIERPYYGEILDRVDHISDYTFVRQGKEPDWSFGLEEAFNFYDQEGRYLMSWAYSRFTGVYNFCIPDAK